MLTLCKLISPKVHFKYVKRVGMSHAIKIGSRRSKKNRFNIDDIFSEDEMLCGSAKTQMSLSSSQNSTTFVSKGSFLPHPKNENQKIYSRHLANPSVSIVFGVGNAGTGKSLFACHHAIQSFDNGTVDKIVITRPAVCVDEDLGALPGTLEEKMAPWTRPIFDIFYKYYPVKKVKHLIEEQLIEICPLAFMRGRTFDKSFIIADEMQNSTPSQMKMLLTRIGSGSKMVVTGDEEQHDRGFENNGLRDFLYRIESHHGINHDMSDLPIKVVRFCEEDCERNPVIKQIFNIYH